MLSFRARLAALVLVAFGIRLAAAWANRRFPVAGDALTYHLEAGLLARGEGFRRVFEDVPTAEHPPAHTVVLAAADLLGAHSTAYQRAFLGVLGSVTVGLVGLLGRRVAGERAGLIAAGLAAVYPLLWLPDAALMSETTSTLFVAACLLAAYRLLDRPSAAAAAALGALIGLAALARGEALALLVLLVAPLARRAGRFAVLAGAGLAACALVLAPWTIRNAVTFDAPVLISTNSSGVFVGANCERTYYGDAIGAWVFSCYGAAAHGNEAQRMAEYRSRGLRYAREHAGRVPVVVAARLGRLLDVYRPNQGVFFAATEGRDPRASRVGIGAFWLLAPLAVAGAVLLRRRGETLAILLAPVVLVALVAAAVYGSARLRVSAEPSLVVLAAVTLDAVLRTRRAARRAARRAG